MSDTTQYTPQYTQYVMAMLISRLKCLTPVGRDYSPRAPASTYLRLAKEDLADVNNWWGI